MLLGPRSGNMSTFRWNFQAGFQFGLVESVSRRALFWKPFQEYVPIQNKPPSIVLSEQKKSSIYIPVEKKLSDEYIPIKKESSMYIGIRKVLKLLFALWLADSAYARN